MDRRKNINNFAEHFLISGGGCGIRAANWVAKIRRGFFFQEHSRDGLPPGICMRLWLQ
jgi:hypothetical protein